MWLRQSGNQSQTGQMEISYASTEGYISQDHTGLVFHCVGKFALWWISLYE